MKASATTRLSLTLPEETLDRLVQNSPVADDNQDAIKHAIWTQIELDEADEYTVMKKPRVSRPEVRGMDRGSIVVTLRIGKRVSVTFLVYI
ncbi:hypothetical protein ACLI4Z_08555 [Natrialbaceae archaeon A-arb3/5]